MQRSSVRLPMRVLADADGWRLSKWLVTAGSAVYRNQRVAVLKSLSSGAVDHALAPHPGTVYATCVPEGTIVESSSPPIAEIEFCPHSVVFKGVCAVCGEEAEPAHFAETPSMGESRLPVAYNSTSLSVTRAEAESVASVTARRLFESKRLSLVLDLDHTLVHATDDARAAAILHHSPENVDLASVSSFALGPHPDSGAAAVMHLKLRPNLREFLTRVAAKFELHIYTMGSRPYADRVARLIDPDKRFFSGRITSREDFAEGRCNQKSIQRLFPCDDSMALIVDDREDVWTSGTGQMFMPNLIRADPYSFWDGLSEAYDRASSTKEPNPSTLSRNAQLAHPPAPVVLHVNGNGEPLKQTSVLSASKSISPNGNGRVDLRQASNVSTEEGIGPKPVPSGGDEQNSVPNDNGETHKPVIEGRVSPDESDRKWEGADGDNSWSAEKEEKKEKEGREDGETEARRVDGLGETQAATGKTSSDLKRQEDEGNTSTLTGASEVNGRVVNQDATELAPDFSGKLREIVKGWWDADMSQKSKDHLLRLAQVLEDCHSEFFRQSKIAMSAQYAERRAQKSNAFQAPADVKGILADMRREVLVGCVITFTGVIPTGANPETIPAWNLALRLGAVCSMDFVNGRTTHVVASQHRSANTQKCKDAMNYGTAFIVTMKWLEDSALNFERQDEVPYCDRAKRGFSNSLEFRATVEKRYVDAARILKKRRNADLDDISSREVSLPKRRKTEEKAKHNDHKNGNLVTKGSEVEVHVLSGDEIGAAMDAAFDE